MSYKHLVVTEPFDGYERGQIIKDPLLVAKYGDRDGFVVARQPGADEDDTLPEPSVHSGPEPTTAEERTEALTEPTAPPKKR